MLNSTFLLAASQEVTLILIAIAFIGMMVFMNLNQKKKQKKMIDLNSKITVGDRVKTAGGIFGVIESVNEENNTFIIKSSETRFEIDRGFVYSMRMLGLPVEEAVETPVVEVAEEVEVIEVFETVEENSEVESDKE